MKRVDGLLINRQGEMRISRSVGWVSYLYCIEGEDYRLPTSQRRYCCTGEHVESDKRVLVTFVEN